MRGILRVSLRIIMKPRFRLFRRKNGIFFVEDRITRKQASLQTRERAIARQLFHARNEAYRQPALNLQIARTYLPASDVGFVQRTWCDVMTEFLKTKTGPNRIRSEHAVAEKAFDSLRDLPLLDTRPEHFLRVLESGGVSTNSYLRRFHNFAADLDWLPWPVMPKRQWA